MDGAAGVVREIAADTGVHVRLCARPVGVEDPALQVAVEAGTPTPIASLYKLPLAAAWADLVRDGTLDPLARLRLPALSRAPGETGVACLADDVEASQRDVVRLMLSVSDNACAEALLELVGLHRVARWLDGCGLSPTTVRLGSAESLRRVIAETGGRSLSEAMTRLADPAHDRGTSEYDAALTSSSTAAEFTAMLCAIWPGDAYDWVKQSMRRQAWRHRIGSGFPHDDVAVSGKTGTLGRLRHEAAVVQFPLEHPVAVTVLTVSIRPELHQPRVDAAIGAMARAAVTALRVPHPLH